MRDFHRHMLRDGAYIRWLMARDAAARAAAISHMVMHHHRNVWQCTAIHREHHREPYRHLRRIASGRAFQR